MFLCVRDVRCELKVLLRESDTELIHRGGEAFAVETFLFLGNNNPVFKEKHFAPLSHERILPHQIHAKRLRAAEPFTVNRDLINFPVCGVRRSSARRARSEMQIS